MSDQIVGGILWVVAVAVDAPLVAVILPALMVIGGAMLMVRAGDRSTEGCSRRGRGREPVR